MSVPFKANSKHEHRVRLNIKLILSLIIRLCAHVGHLLSKYLIPECWTQRQTPFTILRHLLCLVVLYSMCNKHLKGLQHDCSTFLNSRLYKTNMSNFRLRSFAQTPESLAKLSIIGSRDSPAVSQVFMLSKQQVMKLVVSSILRAADVWN